MSSSTNNFPVYGQSDSSYHAAGQEQGLRKLAQDFYTIMDELPEAKLVRDMHKEDLEVMAEKLALFLSLWLGGPRTYIEKYGNANMPMVHKDFVINERERDTWLLCMDKALEQQEYSDSFKDYLRRQFRFPAEMIRKTSKFS